MHQQLGWAAGSLGTAIMLGALSSFGLFFLTTHLGVGVTLSRAIARTEMTVLPAPSAFSLAASRLGWALQETICLSLHGRPVELIRPHLHPGARILALTSDSDGPAALAGLLSEAGFGCSSLTVLEALGGPRERVSTHQADTFALAAVDMLNVCAVDVGRAIHPSAEEVAANPRARSAVLRVAERVAP